MKIDIINVKLSAQRALLGNVSSKLRAVCVNIENNKILVFYYYDGIISKEDKELYNHSVDQIVADFWEGQDGEDIEFYTPLIQKDYPQNMPLIGHWIYYRSEK